MLADTESEKSKWVVALSELHRILKRNNLPNTMVRTAVLLLWSSACLFLLTDSSFPVDKLNLVISTALLLVVMKIRTMCFGSPAKSIYLFCGNNVSNVHWFVLLNLFFLHVYFSLLSIVFDCIDLGLLNTSFSFTSEYMLLFNFL